VSAWIELRVIFSPTISIFRWVPEASSRDHVPKVSTFGTLALILKLLKQGDSSFLSYLVKTGAATFLGML
jgi:hypothetical protein